MLLATRHRQRPRPRPIPKRLTWARSVRSARSGISQQADSTGAGRIRICVPEFITTPPTTVVSLCLLEKKSGGIIDNQHNALRPTSADSPTLASDVA
jgi:hypothetical protein